MINPKTAKALDVEIPIGLIPLHGVESAPVRLFIDWGKYDRMYECNTQLLSCRLRRFASDTFQKLPDRDRIYLCYRTLFQSFGNPDFPCLGLVTGVGTF